ncbi:Pheromone B alpha 3 receptor [Serendipita indica DSM 11827]|uniref:Related to a2-pheromone receptor Pra1 n=1 Tax=Serendipita indica (strain DSM 11827) TaxID=1109443 RepID=G4TIC5_SERID|nr:Pheromone B alpha 3 receptor [Serendipita indica DSM 11827]CCA71091.1 related to a2-pheromone receptor Pra1 [Serendipita indica DSM 11827]
MAPVGISNLFPYQQIVLGISLLSIILVSPAHLKSGNTGITILIFWIFGWTFFLFINSIIWRGNVRVLHGYCDVAAAFFAITPQGLSCAFLCITRQLYRLSKAQAVIITKAQKRRDLFIDLAIGLGFPILILGGHALIQGHRYDVWEDFGCYATTYNVVLAYPLYMIWPLIASLASAVYGSLALQQFFKRRESFESLLSSTNSGMQKNRYIRLMWLCCIDLLLVIPFHIYNLIDNLTNQKVFPYKGWADIQADWYRVDLYRRIIIDMLPTAKSLVITCLVANFLMVSTFVALFGFTRETSKMYRNVYYWCMRPFGVQRPARVMPGATTTYKRTWLDKLFRREGVQLRSTTNTTGSIPTFAQSRPDRSIPSARQYSATDTLNLEEEYDEKAVASPLSARSVIVVDGKRLTIPGLNAMASFDSAEMHKATSAPHSPSSTLSGETAHQGHASSRV